MSCLSPRNCFVKIGFISFCIIPFRFVSFRFVSVYFVSRFVSQFTCTRLLIIWHAVQCFWFQTSIRCTRKWRKLLKSETNTETETNFRILPIYFFFGITIVRVGGKILGSVGRSETHMFFFLALPYLFNSWLCHCWLVIQIEFTQENNSHTNFVHSARGGNSKYHVQLVLSHWYFEFHLNVFAH